MYAKQVALVETDLVGLAEAMPSDKYDFRPTNGEFTGVRTFGEQVKHAATMIYFAVWHRIATGAHATVPPPLRRV